MLFNIVKTALPFSGCLYHRHKPRAKGSLKTKFRKAKVALAVLRLIFLMDLPLRLIAARATYFLCFAKESKQKKGDPDVQVRCANYPHSASFFRRVRTSRATRVVGQAHAFFRKKNAPFG